MKTTQRNPKAKPGKSAQPRAKRAGRRPGKLRPKVIKLKRILVPLDFSEHSEKALLYAVKLAEQFSARIDLISVVEPIMYADGMTFPAGTGDLGEASAQESG
ncbi:MAG: universal stress protein, partial [Limisphaerales bacterium]